MTLRRKKKKSPLNPNRKSALNNLIAINYLFIFTIYSANKPDNKLFAESIYPNHYQFNDKWAMEKKIHFTPLEAVNMFAFNGRLRYNLLLHRASVESLRIQVDYRTIDQV